MRTLEQIIKDYNSPEKRNSDLINEYNELKNSLIMDGFYSISSEYLNEDTANLLIGNPTDAIFYYEYGDDGTRKVIKNLRDNNYFNEFSNSAILDAVKSTLDLHVPVKTKPIFGFLDDILRSQKNSDKIKVKYLIKEESLLSDNKALFYIENVFNRKVNVVLEIPKPLFIQFLNKNIVDAELVVNGDEIVAVNK